MTFPGPLSVISGLVPLKASRTGVFCGDIQWDSPCLSPELDCGGRFTFPTGSVRFAAPMHPESTSSAFKFQHGAFGLIVWHLSSCQRGWYQIRVPRLRPPQKNSLSSFALCGRLLPEDSSVGSWQALRVISHGCTRTAWESIRTSTRHRGLTELQLRRKTNTAPRAWSALFKRTPQSDCATIDEYIMMESQKLLEALRKQTDNHSTQCKEDDL